MTTIIDLNNNGITLSEIKQLQGTLMECYKELHPNFDIKKFIDISKCYNSDNFKIFVLARYHASSQDKPFEVVHVCLKNQTNDIINLSLRKSAIVQNNEQYDVDFFEPKSNLIYPNAERSIVLGFSYVKNVDYTLYLTLNRQIYKVDIIVDNCHSIDVKNHTK